MAENTNVICSVSLRNNARSSQGVAHLQALVLIGGLVLIGTLVSTAKASAHPLTTVYNFCSVSSACKDGALPTTLSMDQAGNLFGVTDHGGFQHAKASGTVYELKKGKKFKSLYRFCSDTNCNDGAFPAGPLVIDTSGNLYGVTSEGGAHDAGTAFEISPNGSGWTYHKLYDFCSQGATCTDGGLPVGGLTYAGAETGVPYDGVSPLYGLTYTGASGFGGCCGVAFQLTPLQGQMSWSETVLYTFCSQGGTDCTDGVEPQGGLLVDAQGNLFGTTTEGGTNHPDGFTSGGGVVFELSPSGGAWTETVLYDFCAQPHCSDGAFPRSALIQDSSGNLFGTTLSGGASCPLSGQSTTCGTLFRLSPNGNTWQESVLHTFCKKTDCPDGAAPVGVLAMDSSGNLFGATLAGGGNDIDQDHFGGGVLFEMSSTSFKILHSFCALSNCADGARPGAGPILTPDGVLFGTTEEGGTGNDGGTAFRLKP